MRLLRVLDLALVFARRRRQVVGAVARRDMVADRGDRLARHLHAVGPHIGDQAGGLAADIDAFVELLRQPHGLLRAEAQLARRLLLQRRGGERRMRVALDALLLDRADVEPPGLDRGAWRACASCSFGRSNCSSFLPSRWVSRAVNGAPAGVVKSASTVQYSRARNASISASRSQIRRSATDCTRPARAAARQLAPQHRREGEAHQVVQRAARQVGLDQRLVEVARVRHGVRARRCG